MGASKSKVHAEGANDAVAAQNFEIVCGDERMATVIEGRWLSKTVTKGLLTPFLEHYNSIVQSAGGDNAPIALSDVDSVHVDEQLVDVAWPVSRLATTQPGTTCHVVIQLKSASRCTFRITLPDNTMTYACVNKIDLRKSLGKALIEPLLDTWNQSSSVSNVQLSEVEAVIVGGLKADTTRPASCYVVPAAEQPVDVHIVVNRRFAWAEEDLASPMQSALSEIHKTVKGLEDSLRRNKDREGAEGSRKAALHSLQLVLQLLESESSSGLWNVDIAGALMRKRGTSITESDCEDDDAARHTRLWLMDLVAPTAKQRDAAAADTEVASTASGDSSFSAGRSSVNPGLQTQSEALQMLHELSWEWDVDVFDELSGGCCLSFLFIHLLESNGLIVELELDRKRLSHFMADCERQYGSNPYHNRCHGADVLLGTYLFLRDTGFYAALSPLERLAALFAAALHDLAHPGSTNGHEVKACSELALRYNDLSCLENYHCASAFERLVKTKYNFVASFSTERFAEFRKTVCKMILATDLSVHFDVISQLNAIRNGTLSVGTSSQGKAATSRPASATSGLADTQLLLSTAIKFADLGHTLKPWAQHKKWSQRVAEEMLLLGDRERDMGLAISPMCDRNREMDTNLPENQVRFLDFICFPFYKAASRVIPHLDERLARLDANHSVWLAQATQSRAGG